MTQHAEDFAALRGYLLDVGYRITGSRADAGDAVQDARLRAGLGVRDGGDAGRRILLDVPGAGTPVGRDGGAEPAVTLR